MHRVCNLKYLLADVTKNAPNAVKVAKGNIKAVKIDFPLPDKVHGIEKRLNNKNTFEIPKEYSQKYKPEVVIGKNLRLSYLNQNPEQYIGQIITVTGWAR